MVMRIAKPEDFNTFNYLYNFGYDILYEYQPNGLIENDDCIRSSHFTEDYEKVIELSKITETDYQKILNVDYSEIFMLESSNSIIGFIFVTQIAKELWKLCDICVIPEFQNSFKEIICLLFDCTRIKELEICTPFFPVSTRLPGMIVDDSIFSFYRVKQP